MIRELTPIQFLLRVTGLKKNQFSPSKTFEYEKEAIGGGILMFTNSNHAIIIFVPAIISLLTYLFTPWVFKGSFSMGKLQQLEIEHLTTMLRVFKICFLVLIGYFGVIRFQQRKASGEYGFWLALGMERMTFYNYLVVGFAINGLISGVIVLSQILLLEKLYLPLTDFLILAFLLFTSLLMASSLMFAINEAVENAELSFLAVLLIYVIALLFVGKNQPLDMFLNAEFYFHQYGGAFLGLIQLGVAIIAQYFGWRLHREIDIELGG